ncbi:hypothetical protein DMI69_08955 [Escherichia coli]|nr:hypothetical protein [Escherichia coli]
MRRNAVGALSTVALVAGEKTPHVAGMHLTISRGLILNLDHSRIAAKRSLQHRRLYDARRTGHGLLA